MTDILEEEYAIKFQLEIALKWGEHRASFHNLKIDETLNVLSEEDIHSLWLPNVVYENTNQKLTTRLGYDFEWKTHLLVERNSDGIRSGPELIDEREIFKGSENNLVMLQTYTHAFQCSFRLVLYPFDTQVGLDLSTIYILY